MCIWMSRCHICVTKSADTSWGPFSSHHVGSGNELGSERLYPSRWPSLSFHLFLGAAHVSSPSTNSIPTPQTVLRWAAQDSWVLLALGQILHPSHSAEELSEILTVVFVITVHILSLYPLFPMY